MAVEIIKELQQWGFRRERGAGGQLVWGEQRFCQRTGEAAPHVCRGDPLQSWRLVATRSTRTVHELATVCTYLLQWEAANPLHPRDRLWAARAESLLPPHDRSPHVASREHVVHHDQSGREHSETVGNTYGLRTWIEYGFKHAKNELGWADFRITDYASIERWWELVSCAYLPVSLQNPVFQPASTEPASSQAASVPTPTDRFSEHRCWDPGQGWKNILNNFRLILQPPPFHYFSLPC